MTTPSSLEELRDLATVPCTRCYECNFKEQGECKNPYKECSTCAVIRSLSKEFRSHMEALMVENGWNFGPKDTVHLESYFKGELNILKSYVYIFDEKYRGIPAVDELRNQWHEDHERIKEALEQVRAKSYLEGEK